MSPDGFLCSKMIDVRSRDRESTVFFRSTARASAAFFNGTEVFGVSSVFEIQDATRGDGIAEALEKVSGQRDAAGEG
jgi:hypothetical protein